MKVTVFTPTYNRSATLPRLYKSLKSQKSKNFEWIVVDDGSTDSTEKLIKQWQRKKERFDIIYKKQTNGGKHRAINTGLKLARGEMFFIVDSDDYIRDNAIEWIINEEAKIQKQNFAGLAGHLEKEDGSAIGSTISGDYIDATSLERKKYHIDGDKAEVFYTDVLRKFPFPEIDGEKFMSEAVVWNRIAAAGYKIRWINKGIYVGEYRADGLTNSIAEHHKNSPIGYTLYIKELIHYPQISFVQKLNAIGSYTLCMHDHQNWRSISVKLDTNIIMVTLGIIVHKARELVK